MLMSELPSQHASLGECLDRWQAGDGEGRRQLVTAVLADVERLVGVMFRRFPKLHRHLEACDVTQEALVRLLRTLEQLNPDSVQDFYGLAATHVRRALLDIARHYARGERRGLIPCGGGDQLVGSLPCPEFDPEELDRWAAFHEAVERLPPAEREVVSLAHYHGWTQSQIGELLNMSERTVRRRWDSALAKLRELAGRLGCSGTLDME